MKKKVLSLVLAVLMVVSLLPVAAFAKVEPQLKQESELSAAERNAVIAQNRPQKAGETGAAGGVTVTPVSGDGLEVKEQPEESAQAAYVTNYDDADMVRVMVVLEGVSLLDSGFSKEELSSVQAAYVQEAMEEMQDALVSQIQTVVDELALSAPYARSRQTAQVETLYHYTTLLNGVSLRMPYGALETVREMAGVDAAFVVPTYSVPEDMTYATADPAMLVTKTDFGSASAWDAGYTGDGMKIAIIDTGLDADHPSFAADPAGPSLDEGDIEAVLTQLNSYERFSAKSAVDLKARNLYRSAKVAYGFNYVDNDLDITHDKDQQGDHGTHVAGITAANHTEGTEVVGVAPDAQLLIMKVFGKNGGAYWDDIVAALEDSMVLGADAVNMSLGSPAGFSQSDESLAEFNEWADRVYAEAEEHDLVLAIAAGNSYSAAFGTPLGTNMNLASDPDNGIVSSPATYRSATMVASLENAAVMYNYVAVGGEKVPYTDVAAYPFLNLAAYGQTEYTYVMVDGYGTAADFAAVGESWENYGKIAVISRGALAFTEKQTNASNAGFSGLIVYNNGDDGLMNMEDSGLLPNIFTDKAGGAVLAAAADENGEGTLVIASDMTRVDSPTGGQLSDFSSWGVSSDLTLNPDVTAPGGNIYSTVNNGKYGVMSGTSMATPHIAGMSALVMEHLHRNYAGNSDSWYHTVAEALIMSTAEPVADTNGILYSPRKQGAGSANVYAAVTAPAYLTVDGSTPKASLGDDDSKKGEYSFTFQINNLTDAALSYRLDGTTLTDQVVELDGVKYMSETGRELDATVSFAVDGVFSPALDYNEDGLSDRNDVQDFLDDVNYERTVNGKWDLTGDGKIDTADVQALYQLLDSSLQAEALVTVPADGSLTVRVTVKLTAQDKAYMDANYENGIYVDGFVRCYGQDAEGDLSLPFMAFYGDWSAAPAMDDTGWDLFNEAPKRYWNVLWTDVNYYYNLGANPYVTEERNDAHNVLSPNGDGYQDAIQDIYLGMLRNARKVNFILKDGNGQVVRETTGDYVRKSYYNSGYGLCIPYIYSNYVTDPLYDFADAQELSHYTFTIEAYLDDGDEVADDIVTMPIVIDTTAPTIDPASVKQETVDGKRMLTFTVSDNYDVAAVITMTTAGSIIERIPVDTKTAGVDGETATITLDVSKYDTEFVVVATDYGFNEIYYNFSFDGEGTTNVNSDAFYGYRQMSVIASGNYLVATAAYNGWYSFEDASSMLMHTDAYYSGEAAVQAAEYVDGWIIGVDVNNNIFASKAGSWDRNVFGTLGDYPMALDMAYDFTRDILYVLTDEAVAGEGGYLLKLDVLTGELTELCQPTGYANDQTVYDSGYVYVRTHGQALTLACDNDGVLYTINHADGDLYTLDPETGVATLVGATGYSPKYYQSMTVDHATNKLYWAAYQSYTGTSHFYEVDKATGKATEASSEGIQHNAQLTGLFKPYTAYSKDIIPDAAALTGMQLNTSGVTLAAGTQTLLTAASVPYYAALNNVRWSSDDTSVATVDETGVVTAVSQGEATITASCDGQTAQCVITVLKVEADLMVHDAMNLQWLTFQANQPQNARDAYGMTTVDSSYNYFISAAYAHGTVYAFDYYGNFYQMDAETKQGTRVGANIQFNGTSGLMLAMSYNYADGYLYGIGQVVNGWDSYYYLVRINPANGKHTVVGEFDAMSYGIPVNLAVDRNGTFYTVMDVTDYSTYEQVSRIYTFNAEDVYGGYLDITEGENLRNFAPSETASVSSLVWSEDNGCLLWANYYGQLLRVLPESGETLLLGYIGNTAGNSNIMNTCLVEFVENEPESPAGVEITGLSMQDSFKLLVGSSVSVSVAVEPWNASADFEYQIEDTGVATISDKGILTGISEGTTTLTVTEKTSGESLTADITVVPSTGDIYGVVVQDLNYGANYFVAIPDTDPTSIEPIYDFSLTNFAPYAGAYYDGYLYAYSHVVEDMQDLDGFDYEYKYYLLKIDLVDYSFEVLGNNRRVHETMMDMAFDYTTGTMYGVAYNSMSASSLVQINLETAQVTEIGRTLDGEDKLDLRTLTVDAEGRMYAITVDGKLYQLDKTTGEGTFVGETGIINLDAYQSMTYDYDTGNTYWAQYGNDGTNGLQLLDLETGAATNLGSVYGVGASVAALYTVSENEPAVPAVVEAEGIALPEKQTVVVGDTLTLEATVLPVSVAEVEGEVEWSSDNTAVATVEDGVVTGVKAGTAVITASVNGIEAQCVVTVTAEARRFYAYDEDNRQWISFTAEDPTVTTVERADAEDEEKIMASLYHDGKLYSFTADGKYWSVNPETFERTLISDDFADLYAGIEISDWWGGVETNYYKLMPLSMAYDETEGQAYVQMMAYELMDYGYDFYDFFSLLMIPIDLEKGEVEYTFETAYMMDYDTWESYELEIKAIAGDYYQTEEGFTNAVLVEDGIATFVNTFDSGLVTCWNLKTGEIMEVALVFNYWGNAEHGRGMYRDPLTGEVYIIRDMRDWGGPVTLNTLSLTDADITDLGFVGDGANIVNSLFLK